MGTSRRKEQRHPAWRRRDRKKKKKDEESSFRPLPRDRRRYLSVSQSTALCLPLSAGIDISIHHARPRRSRRNRPFSLCSSREACVAQSWAVYACAREKDDRATEVVHADRRGQTERCKPSTGEMPKKKKKKQKNSGREVWMGKHEKNEDERNLQLRETWKASACILNHLRQGRLGSSRDF